MAENFNNNPNKPLFPEENKLRKIKKLVKRPVIRPLSPDGKNPPLRKIKKLVRPITSAPLPPEPVSLSPSAPSFEPEPMADVNEPINFPSYSDDSVNVLLDEQPSFDNAALPSTEVSTQPFSPSQPNFINDTDIAESHTKSVLDGFKEGNLFTKKALVFAVVGMLMLGLFIGKLLFSNSTVVRSGLSGVIANPEVPKGRARCGVAEKTQGCVLYIMNPQRQDLYARDFYDLASQLTGRQRFVIETGNMRYSNVRIAPGEIGQFNIPPLQ